MSVEMVQQRLLDYQCETLLDQENALKEIAQEIALMALSRAGFFRVAAFQGGTCLRIFYGLERFSEDLDFVLNEPNPKFNWMDYLNEMANEFNVYGYSVDFINKSSLKDKAIKSVFLKANSDGGMLMIKDTQQPKLKMQIKLEIDTHPPQGSGYDLKYLDFPMAFSVQTQNQSSLFASKCHALLCRKYVKGRDWYDFLWYVSRKTEINFQLLNAAIQQAGPWSGKHQAVTKDWVLAELRKKINAIDWQAARADIEKFLRPRELPTLNLWSRHFFESRWEILSHTLGGDSR